MKKYILIFSGFVALGLGAIGIFLPIMPTTPFVLLAAACFGSSSPALHVKLKNSKYFGEFIQNYNEKTGVKKSVKIKAITFLWFMLIISAIMSLKPLVITILAIVGIGVTIHILAIKTKKE